MFNKDFLNKLTILYVEDEDLAREKLAKTLKKLFKKVILAPNGLDGFIQFQKAQMNKEPIDLVLSDINMPQMNGIEMLENIRNIDEKVPFIYTTARSESEHLLRAIELNVNHYILKPVNTQDLIMRIQIVCEKKYFENMLSLKQKELENYLEAINHVALVFKMDEEGKLTFANKSFYEITKYEETDLEKLSFNTIIHPDIPPEFIDKAWELIKGNKTWQGNTKFIDKDAETFYINNTTFKADNDLKDEFITIGFLTTQENVEKREFHKKVIKNIQEFNKKESSYKRLIIELNNKVKEYEGSVPNIKKELEEEKSKSLNKERQLNHYEMQMHNVEDKHQKTLILKNKEFEEHLKMARQVKQEKENISKELRALKESMEVVKEQMEKLEESNERKTKRILDLNEIIKDMEDKS